MNVVKERKPSSRRNSTRAESLEAAAETLNEAAENLKGAVAAATQAFDAVKFNDAVAALKQATEALEDIAAARVIERTRSEPAYPAAIAQRLVAGEHPIKVFREHRRLSQSQLAKAAGTSAQYISQIERGARDPGKKLLPRLAAKLSVDEELLR